MVSQIQLFETGKYMSAVDSDVLQALGVAEQCIEDLRELLQASADDSKICALQVFAVADVLM